MEGRTGSSNGDPNMLCNCGIRSPLRCTKSGLNAGRRFYGCLNYKTKFRCEFFMWVNPPKSESTQSNIENTHNLQTHNSELQGKVDELESRVEVLEAMKEQMHKEVQQMQKKIGQMQKEVLCLKKEPWWKKIGFLLIVLFVLSHMYKKMETEKYLALA
ncbi:hypothetical protein RHGRI_033246 [Rhododendron griersonianum]|uniref:GRF-type domain-containing protein n=1 Tax=Rhododendron griersonianum TaxID=479676 RepID=A0AAV6HWV9_9ERIC|nr:hypothetical protein RHGRI_033246 [Rhododendron griersonianum]